MPFSYKLTMLEVHEYHQFTTGFQANEFLDPRDDVGYSLDSKTGKFCQ